MKLDPEVFEGLWSDDYVSQYRACLWIASVGHWFDGDDRVLRRLIELFDSTDSYDEGVVVSATALKACQVWRSSDFDYLENAAQSATRFVLHPFKGEIEPIPRSFLLQLFEHNLPHKVIPLIRECAKQSCSSWAHELIGTLWVGWHDLYGVAEALLNEQDKATCRFTMLQLLYDKILSESIHRDALKRWEERPSERYGSHPSNDFIFTRWQASVDRLRFLCSAAPMDLVAEAERLRAEGSEPIDSPLWK